MGRRWGPLPPAPAPVGRGGGRSCSSGRRGRGLAGEDRELQATAPQAIGLGPEPLVSAAPVVDPGALAPLALVDRALEAAQVGDAVVLLGPLVGDQPDAARAR